MKKLKKMLVIILTVAFLLNNQFTTPAQAQIPDAFWALQAGLTKALNESNNYNIIYYGEQILSLFRPVNLNDSQSVENSAQKSELVGTAYEAIGDYENAIRYYKDYLPLAKLLGWSDGVYNANAKLKHLAFNPELYVKSSDVENNIFFNAKNEPICGTYAGIAYFSEENQFYKNIADKTGSYLIYDNYGVNAKNFYMYHSTTMIKAEIENKAVEYAFNISNDSGFWDIMNERAYIEELVDFLASYDVPVFFRFGGEMNGNDICNDPQSFITSFRFVAGIVKARSSNIAMVFGPQAVASPEKPFQNYYPGDEYVDWVGVSQYTMKYFLGNALGVKNVNDSFFITGEYANPLTAISLMVDEYGDRKPLMLTECGVTNYTRSPYIEEDQVSNQWAQAQLRRLYSYAPMIYPQLKAIHYFNVDMSSTETERFSLYNSPVMADLYNNLTANDIYLNSTKTNSPFRYKKVTAYQTTGNIIELSTYAVYPKTTALQVFYWIDGTLVKQTDTIPYDANIDTGLLNNGTHILEVSIVNNSSILRIMQYQIIKSDGQIILKKENVFADVTGSSFEWAKAQIEDLTAINIINGVEIEGVLYYRPEQNITRAEYTKLVVRAFGLTTINQNCNFSDVSTADWYYQFVAAAYNSGIVKGRTEGGSTVFAPDEPISRQDMCVIITNAIINISGMIMIDENEINTALNAFGDKLEISDYATKYVAFAYSKGIINGSNNDYGVRIFRPQDYANRAETAIVIMNGVQIR